MGTVWNPQIAFDNITIFTTLILRAREHRNHFFLQYFHYKPLSASGLDLFVGQASFLFYGGNVIEVVF